MTVDFLTSAWTIADSPNPRISAQVISHVIDPVIASACKMAWPTSDDLLHSEPNHTPGGYMALGRVSAQH